MLQNNCIPEHYQKGAEEIARALQESDDILISAHVNPDGDAVGALVAASCICTALQKRHVLYSSTGIPAFLQFFPLPQTVYKTLDALPFTPERAFFVDCGEFHRLGGDLEAAAPRIPRINVDHHRGDGMGTVANFVCPGASSTTQLLAYVAAALHIPLTGLLAEAVALGLITDTGGFAFSNTTADVFALAAQLAENGCDFAALRESVDHTVRVEKMRLWGALVQHVRFLAEGRVACLAVGRADLERFSATRDDLEGLVEYLRRIQSVEISAILREEEPNLCRFSLRSIAARDVWAIASALSGGGHRNAAGGTLKEPLALAEEHVLQAILHALDQE